MSFPTDDPNANSEDNVTDLFSEFANANYSDLTFTDVFTEEIAYVLNVYFTPALVLLGTIGNLLSIIVFFKSKLRAQSTSQYLSALAISDTIFLLQLIPPWLKAVRISTMFARDGFCQSFVYFTYVSSSSSSWLVVSFTIERFVAVLYPLRRTRMCTVRRARLLILGIVISCMAINTPVLKFAVPKGNDCNIDYDLMDHAARFNVVDTIFSFTLPLTIITVLNIWIMIGVCRLSRARGHLIKEEEMQPRAGRGRGRGRGRGPRRQTRATLPGRSTRSSQQRITRMLLIVSSVFVLLNLPAYSMRIVAYANNMSSYEYNGRWAALQQICLLFFNSNFGINFFLYCMTGQNFRRALCQTFSCLARYWAALKRFFCCRANAHAQPPRPSVTNSLSINTEASAYAAASRVSLSHNKKGAISRCKDAAYGSYLELWRFDNSQHEQQTPVHYELQVFPVQSYWFASGRPQRPVPRWPENALRNNHPEPVHNPISPVIPTSLVFRPIRHDLQPGQVAPGSSPGTESSTPIASTCSSPKPASDCNSPKLANACRSPLPAKACSSPMLTNACRSSLLENTYRASLPASPLLPEELESFVPTSYDCYFTPIDRPQPPRKFSLPARQLQTLERANTPPGWVDVQLPRWDWGSPPASGASMLAPDPQSPQARSLSPHAAAAIPVPPTELPEATPVL